MKFSQKTNGLVYSTKYSLKIIFINYFRVQYHSKRLMSCRCVCQSAIKIDHSLILSWSWLRLFAEASMSLTTENKDVSSTNNLYLLLISSINCWRILKTTKVPKWILVVHQRKYQSKTNTDHSQRLFAFCLLQSPLKY